MNGINTIVMHNTCEDSLLAAPLIIDLILLSEMFTRINYKTSETPQFSKFHPVLSAISYLFKAPMVPPGTPVVNALTKQQRMLTNILCACLGLPPDGDMLLEHKTRMSKRAEPMDTIETSSVPAPAPTKVEAKTEAPKTEEKEVKKRARRC